MLALVLAFEWVVRRYEAGACHPLVELSWCFAGKAASRKAEGASVLAFGDSLVKYGISPPVLQAGTGEPAYNLGAFGGPPALSYFMLRRVIESGGRPKKLILVFMPANLAACAQGYIEDWQAMASPRECLDLALTTRDPAFFGSLIAGKLCPSVRKRHELRDWVQHSLRGVPHISKQLQAGPSDQLVWRENRGYHLRPTMPWHVPVPNLADWYLFRASWRCDPPEVAYLFRFLELAAEHRMTVYCLLPPIIPGAQEARDRTGVDAQFTAQVRYIQKVHPEIVVVDARHANYPAKVFTDNVHLNADGATRLSQDLADCLLLTRADGPTRTHWANLPVSPENLAGRTREDPASRQR
jgi:hypothetical protein